MEVSNVMVALYQHQLGRGPTHARTVWSGPDALTCFLEDTPTPAERNLVALGEHKVLRDRVAELPGRVEAPGLAARHDSRIDVLPDPSVAAEKRIRGVELAREARQAQRRSELRQGLGRSALASLMVRAQQD